MKKRLRTDRCTGEIACGGEPQEEHLVSAQRERFQSGLRSVPRLGGRVRISAHRIDVRIWLELDGRLEARPDECVDDRKEAWFNMEYGS